MLFLLLYQFPWDEDGEDIFADAERKVGERLHVISCFEFCENHADPGVIGGCFEAVEGFAEGEMADQVECCVTVPGRNIEWCWVREISPALPLISSARSLETEPELELASIFSCSISFPA